MRDIFYFTQQKITLDDIKSVGDGLGYKCNLILWVRDDGTPYPPSLTIHYSQQDYWRWEETSEDDFYEPEDKAKLAEMGEYSGFHVTYTWISMPTLRKFMRQILQLYSGWVACNDVEIWASQYTLENIDSMKCFQDEA